MEKAILGAVAESLADRMAASDAQSYVEQVVRRVRLDAEKRLIALDHEAAQADLRILEVVDLGIGGGIDPEACNLRIQARVRPSRQARKAAPVG
jgi:hypothetical protein